MKKATFLQRLIAYLVDMVILAIATSLLVAFLVAILAMVGSFSGGLDESWVIALAGIGSLLVVAVALVIQFLYFGYLWSRHGRSIGMGGMNLWVAGKDGNNLSFVMAGLRGTVGYYISSFVLYLGFLWMLFDPDQDTWHDKIFNSQVLQD
jgi:uncharacterized RDD family membrane protein YckC